MVRTGSNDLQYETITTAASTNVEQLVNSDVF